MVHQPPRVLEQGDLFFYFRPRLGVEQVEGIDDVQRLYMVMAPPRVYRVFTIGKKRLPELEPAADGTARRDRRSWALNVLTSTDRTEVRRELEAKRYLTKTRGERHLAPAAAIAEGRYELLWHRDHTEILMDLAGPAELGPPEDELEIRPEASYVVSVKNPTVAAPGVPAPPRPPNYPPACLAKFQGRRWIPADDPALLDYEGAQVLLVGAHGAGAHHELGIPAESIKEPARPPLPRPDRGRSPPR